MVQFVLGKVQKWPFPVPLGKFISKFTGVFLTLWSSYTVRDKFTILHPYKSRLEVKCHKAVKNIWPLGSTACLQRCIQNQLKLQAGLENQGWQRPWSKAYWSPQKVWLVSVAFGSLSNSGALFCMQAKRTKCRTSEEHPKRPQSFLLPHELFPLKVPVCTPACWAQQ